MLTTNQADPPPTMAPTTEQGGRDIVLVHTSDLHVEDELVERSYNGLIGLRSVLATAARLAADIVLLAGDTFDNHRISAPVLAQAAALLAQAGRPVVLLPGNHDPALPDCLFRRAGIIGLPDIHVLGITHPDAVRFEQHGLEIWGHAHRGFGDMAPLRTPRQRATRWQIVMAHGHYVPPDERALHAHRAWRIHDEEIAATAADYMALGHWDRPLAVGDGRVPAYYSGSPDLAGTVNVIRLGAGGVTVERTALDWS